MVIYFRDGFESGDLTAWDNIMIRGGPSSSVMVVDTPVLSGLKSCKLTAASLTEQGRAQISTEEPGRLQLTEFYWAYWMYIPTDYRFSIDGWDYVFDMHYTQSGLVYNFVKTYIDNKGAVYDEFWARAPQSYGHGFANIPIPKGQWVHFQLYFKLGVTDGIYRIWQDDVMIFDFVNVDTATVTQSPVVEEPASIVAPYVKSCELKTYLSPSETNIMTKYVDDAVLASEKIPMNGISPNIVVDSIPQGIPFTIRQV